MPVEDQISGSDELAALRTTLAEAESRTLDYWISAVTASSNGSMTVRAIQSSMSWRVTRPLRVTTMVYRRAREAGLKRTVLAIRARLAVERQARRRG